MTESRRVDVVHVCYGGEGGQLVVAQTLACEFRRSGIASGVIALAPPEEMLTGTSVWEDMQEVERVPINRRADVRSMVRTALAVRSMRPRVALCHSHRHAPAMFAGMLAAGVRPRVVLVEHHSTDLRSRSDNLRSGIALLVSSGVVLLSAAYKAAYPFRSSSLPGARRQAVIPNGVDTSRFGMTQSRSQDRDQSLVLGMASRLADTKQHDMLIRAAATIREQGTFSGIRVRLAGVGPTLPRLSELVAELGLEEEVEFLGHVGGRDLVDFFESLDVYVHATLGEGLSIALLEAAAAGVPIVASDVVGVNTVFEAGRTALLVPPSDPTALAEAIVDAAGTNVGASMAARARVMVEEHYSARSMMAGYARFFARLDPSGPWTLVLEKV